MSMGYKGPGNVHELRLKKTLSLIKSMEREIIMLDYFHAMRIKYSAEYVPVTQQSRELHYTNRIGGKQSALAISTK